MTGGVGIKDVGGASRTSGATRTSDLFEPLRWFCLGCGTWIEADRCADAVEPSQLGFTGGTGIAGRRIEARRGLSRRPGVVAGVHGDDLEVVWLEHAASVVTGSPTIERVPARKARIVGEPAGVTQVGTMAGELLAAALVAQLPEPARRVLWGRAVADARRHPVGKRQFATDALALRAPEVLAELQLTESELAWWQAQAAWGAGDRARALERLLDLPQGRYPLQLALWWRAARQGLLTGDLRARAEPALWALAAGSAVCGVAVTLILRAAWGGDTAQASAANAALVRLVDQVIAAAPSPDWRRLQTRLTAEVADLPAARLMGALRHGAASLGDDPHILDAAPPAVLDDLIDRQVIPTAWIDRAAELRCGPYLLARTRIEALDGEALDRLGAHDERARRSLVAGQPLPAGLPEQTRQRFDRASAALTGDEDSMVSLVAESAARGGPALDIDQLRRVLADPSALPPTDLLVDGSLAALLARRSTLDATGLPADELSETQRQFTAQVMLGQAKGALHSWDWPAALKRARDCLRFARQEAQRDEALNLIAAAHWQLGNDDAAVKALGTALEGEYTASLQANIAAVAAELEPETAARHLTRLVIEAPNLALRVSAARQAVLIWRHTPEPWLERDTLPPDIADALRSLVAAPMEEDDFRDVVQLLAEYDGDWLARPGALHGSPHEHSLPARVWVARALGLEHFVRELAQAIRTGQADWALPLRDDLVGAAIDALLVDEPPIGVTGFGVMILTEDLPMPPEMRTVLRAFVTRGVVMGIDSGQSEPGLLFLEWLEDARREIEQVVGEMRPRVEGAVLIAYNALAAAYLVARHRAIEEARGLYTTMATQLQHTPRYAINRQAVQKAVTLVSNVCQDTQELMARLRPHVTDELAPAIDELVATCRVLQQSVHQLPY